MQLAIVLYPGMTTLDAIGPYEVLRLMPDVDLRFVWHEPGPITTDSGVLVLGATHGFDETPSPDVVLVPGSGTATLTTANDPGVQAWLRRVHATTTWTTSVCTGSVILGAAGLLEGRRATSHWAAVQGLAAYGATPVGDERVVRDGKVLTAAGVSAGIDLALWLAAELHGQTVAEGIQLMIEYDPQPPFTAGSYASASGAAKRATAAIVAREGAALARTDPRALAHEAAGIPRVAWSAALARARRRSS